MPLGHLMVGLLGAFAGVAAALMAGWPLWSLPLAYALVGNLCLGASLVAHRLSQPPRRPPRRRGRRPLALHPLRVEG